jgi:hypothetical protein
MTEGPGQPPSYDDIENAATSAGVAFKNAASKLWADNRKDQMKIEDVIALRGLLDAWLKALSDKEELRLTRERYLAERRAEE